ncbi:MAG: hypothetical protein ABL895_03125 [Cyclobacteriaceae bacterium]
MRPQIKKAIFWTPRLLTILFAAFISLFALDSFVEGGGFQKTMSAFMIHLIPTAIVVTILILSWKREWIGGVIFLLLGVAYAIVAISHPQWILAISGPLLAISTLFLIGWFRRNEIRSK